MIALSAGGLGGALAIGIAGTIVVSLTLVPLILFGGFIVPAYNFERFGGGFHTDFWFAAAWAGFSGSDGLVVNALSAPLGQGSDRRAAAILACCWLIAAQRRLSTPVRELRRRTVAVRGEQRFVDGTVSRLTRDGLVAPLDGALKALSVAVPLLAVALLAIRS